MKRLYATLIALTAVSALSFALDFGGTLENDSSYSSKAGLGFTQKDTGHLWFTAELGNAWNFNATVEGTFNSATPLFYGDIEQLSLTGTFQKVPLGPSVFTVELGRFFFSEASQRVFANRMDGFRMDFAYPSFTLQTALGYTGFLNKYYASIVMSKLDAVDSNDTALIFSPPRMIGSVSLNFPELVAQQSLTVTFLAQEDLRNRVRGNDIPAGTEVYNPSGGGLVDTQYWGLALDGPVTRNVYYNVYGYLNTGRSLTFGNDTQSSTGQSYQYQNILAYLAGLSLRYYIPQFYQALASATFLYASGDGDTTTYYEGNGSGNLTQFVPVSGSTLGTAFSPSSSNILATELAFSLKPLGRLGGPVFQSLQTALAITPFFKPSAGAVSDGTVESSATGYLGTDVALKTNLRPFSDLGAGLTVGYFIPNSAAFVPGNDTGILYGQLFFSVSF